MNARPVSLLSVVPGATPAAATGKDLPHSDVFAQLLGTFGAPPAGMPAKDAGADHGSDAADPETNLDSALIAAPDPATRLQFAPVPGFDPLSAAVLSALDLRFERALQDGMPDAAATGSQTLQALAGKLGTPIPAQSSHYASTVALNATNMARDPGNFQPLMPHAPSDLAPATSPLPAAASLLPAAADAALGAAASMTPSLLGQAGRGKTAPSLLTAATNDDASASARNSPANLPVTPLATPAAVVGIAVNSIATGQDALFALPATNAAPESQSAAERPLPPAIQTPGSGNLASSPVARDPAVQVSLPATMADAVQVLGSATPSQPVQHGGVTTSARADGAIPPISVPFSSPNWGNQFASRVVNMAQGQLTEAEIRVSPAELGPIEVKLRFDGDRVHAHFGVISPEARDALNSNMHRLREMFASEGLGLGQTFVGQHSSGGGDRTARGSSTEINPFASAADDLATTPASGVRSDSARSGLLDEFA